ncbi:hypothetical protein NKH77_51535 [Streptomyces sp. M19]
MSGWILGEATAWGLTFDSALYPARFTQLVWALLLLVALAVATLRRGRAGRRLLATRSDERAAAAGGVSVVGAKLASFAIASAFAGLAGALLAYQAGSTGASTSARSTPTRARWRSSPSSSSRAAARPRRRARRAAHDRRRRRPAALLQPGGQRLAGAAVRPEPGGGADLRTGRHRRAGAARLGPDPGRSELRLGAAGFLAPTRRARPALSEAEVVAALTPAAPVPRGEVAWTYADCGCATRAPSPWTGWN